MTKVKKEKQNVITAAAHKHCSARSNTLLFLPFACVSHYSFAKRKESPRVNNTPPSTRDNIGKQFRNGKLYSQHWKQHTRCRPPERVSFS